MLRQVKYAHSFRFIFIGVICRLQQPVKYASNEWNSCNISKGWRWHIANASMISPQYRQHSNFVLQLTAALLS